MVEDIGGGGGVDVERGKVTRTLTRRSPVLVKSRKPDQSQYAPLVSSRFNYSKDDN